MKPIWVLAAAALLAAADACPAVDPSAPSEAAPPARVVQPVQEYFTPFAAGPGGGHDFNSSYTHIGTDFGRMGPGEDRLTWEPGAASVNLEGAGWTGVWHSLAGLAREKSEALDFLRCYPPWIRDAYQPRCVGVTLRAGGEGRLRLEIKTADERVRWEQTVTLHGGPPRDFVLPCNPADLRRAKLLNWVAEPGARITVDQVGLVVEYPAMPYAERVFLNSYAKLARCYVPANGVVKDHQHREAGAFDGLPATGMFALATAAAWRMGIVDRPFAEETLRAIHRATLDVRRAEGLLPHFVEKPKHGSTRAGPYRIHPGTEYSTVDTSLYFHGMLLASQMLNDAETQAGLLNEVRAIRFDHLRDPEGWISHGLREDGRTPLGWSWTDWGGEAALVLLLERLAEQPERPGYPSPGRPPPRVNTSGKVPGGIGFIAEVQSLFYPQFNCSEPDALTRVSWRQARLDLLKEQTEYFPKHKPGSDAAKLGLYGLSAGEGFRSRAYVVNGTQYPGADLIHPHYILMSGQLRPPDDTYKLLQAMESRGLMPPWGLVENVKADLSEYSPLLGSLNASFECLGAYHLSAKALGRPDYIYEASRGSAPLSKAVAAFYPGK
jgi:hypothetical protein